MIETSLGAICLQLMHSITLFLEKKNISNPLLIILTIQRTVFTEVAIYTLFPFDPESLLYFTQNQDSTFSLCKDDQQVSVSKTQAHLQPDIHFLSSQKHLFLLFLTAMKDPIHCSSVTALHKAQSIQYPLGECVTVDRCNTFNNFICSLSH